MKRFLFNALFLSSALSLSGCLGYSLGGSQPAGTKRLFMAPVINKTTESAIELQVTHALRNRIQFDGRIQLASATDADTLMEVTLTDYTLTAIAFDKKDKTTASEYRVKLVAHATLKNAQTGELISEATNYGEKSFNFTADLTTSKRNAARAAADDLAKYLIDDLLERW
jgi:hypothetical protein